MRKHLPEAALAVAIIVGLSSFVGGKLEANAFCAQTRENNAALRGLVDDFISQNHKVTPAEKAKADATTLARFPDHC